MRIAIKKLHASKTHKQQQLHLNSQSKEKKHINRKKWNKKRIPIRNQSKENNAQNNKHLNLKNSVMKKRSLSHIHIKEELTTKEWMKKESNITPLSKNNFFFYTILKCLHFMRRWKNKTCFCGSKKIKLNIAGYIGTTHYQPITINKHTQKFQKHKIRKIKITIYR